MKGGPCRRDAPMCRDKLRSDSNICLCGRQHPVFFCSILRLCYTRWLVSFLLCAEFSGGQWYGHSVPCERQTSPDRSLGSQGSTGLAYRIGTPSLLVLTSSGFCCDHLLLTHLLLRELLQSTSEVQAVWHGCSSIARIAVRKGAHAPCS